MITIWRFDIVFGKAKGYWFQYNRNMSNFMVSLKCHKIIDIGFTPFLFAIYYRVEK